MEKTEGKIRYGLIGIGAQGGSYARFLTNAPAPFPAWSAHRAPTTAHWALCVISTPRRRRCARSSTPMCPSSRIGRI